MEEKTLETIKDRTTLGALAGIAAVLTRDIYSFLAKRIGFSKFYVWNIAADLFVHGKDVFSAWGTVLGMLADASMGGLIGVTFVYFLKMTGKRNPLVKGLGFGVWAWLLLFGILFHSLPHTAPTAPSDALSNLSAYIGHTIFGLTLGLYAKRFLKIIE